jgi:diguanylate cyclase (GGDEF)-like protein
MARPKNPFLKWLLADQSDIEPAVRNALLANMFTSEGVVLLRVVCAAWNDVFCFALSGTLYFWIILPFAVAGGLTYLFASRAATRARRASKPAPTGLFMWGVISAISTQGLLGAGEMASGNHVLQLLAMVVALGGCGTVCSNQYPAQRYALLLIGLFLVPLALGTLCSGDPEFIIVLVMLFIYAAICTATIRDRRADALVQVQARVQSDRQARVDHLTGTSNRLALEESLAELQQSGTTMFSVYCLDVDGLKQINQTYGRAAGDMVLQAIASRLHANIWPGDTVVRTGDDEFLLLAPGVQEPEAKALCRRLRKKIAREPYDLGQPERCNIDVSIGYACAPADGSDFHVLYELASGQLGLAKAMHAAEAQDAAAAAQLSSSASP